MQSLILCYAGPDEAPAREIADFVALNCTSPTVQKPVVFASGDELLEGVEQALSADVAIVLLSRAAVPGEWRRAQWESVFIRQPAELGTSLIFFLLHSCKFPEVLRRGVFFDASDGLLQGCRRLRRWLLRNDPLQPPPLAELPPRDFSRVSPREEVDRLEVLLGDKPGVACDVPRASALQFAHEHEEDFEGVFWIDCGIRSRAGILGETARALGLRLAGRVEQNQRELKAFCGGRRLLLIFEDLAESERKALSAGQRASVIFTEVRERTARPLEEVMRLFGTAEERLRLDALGEAQAHLQMLSKASAGVGSSVVAELGACVFALLRKYDRRAEADEVLTILIENAYAAGDLSGLRVWDWERRWIRESWGEPGTPRTRLGGDAPAPRQLTLDLA